MVLPTRRFISTSVCISGVYVVYIDSKCRKHWPVLRAVNVSEQTHMIDFFNVCLCVYDWGEVKHGHI